MHYYLLLTGEDVQTLYISKQLIQMQILKHEYLVGLHYRSKNEGDTTRRRLQNINLIKLFVRQIAI